MKKVFQWFLPQILPRWLNALSENLEKYIQFSEKLFSNTICTILLLYPVYVYIKVILKEYSTSRKYVN